MPSQRPLQQLFAEIPEYELPDIMDLLSHVGGLQMALLNACHARLLALSHQPAPPHADYLLSAEQIADRMRVSTEWVQEHEALLPFRLQLDQEHRFSARGFDQWIADRCADREGTPPPAERWQNGN